MGALVNEDLVGLICLDRRGCIVEANERGREVLRQEGGLRASLANDARGRLTSHLPEEAEAIERLLEAALGRHARGRPGASLVLGESDNRPSLALHCHAVIGGPHGASGVGAIMAIVPVRLPVSAVAVRRALGLTPAESRVAAALAEGKTVAEIARAAKVRRDTVHWHLKQCYSRTDCRTQAEFVSLVLSVLRLPIRV